MVGRFIQRRFVQNDSHENRFDNGQNNTFSVCHLFVEHLISKQAELSEKVFDRLDRIAVDIYDKTIRMLQEIKDTSQRARYKVKQELPNNDLSTEEIGELETIWLQEVSLIISSSIENKVKKLIEDLSHDYPDILQHLEQIGTGQEVNTIKFANPDLQNQYNELIQLIRLYFPFTHLTTKENNEETKNRIVSKHRVIASLTTRADLIGFSYDIKDKKTKDFILNLKSKIRKNMLSAKGIESEILKLFDLMANGKVKLTVIEIKTKYTDSNNEQTRYTNQKTYEENVDQEDIRDIAHTLFAIFEFFVIQSEKGKISSESDNNQIQEIDTNRRGSIRNIFYEPPETNVGTNTESTSSTSPKTTRFKSLLENRDFLSTLRKSIIPIFITVNMPHEILKKIADQEKVTDENMENSVSKITYSCKTIPFDHTLINGIKTAMRRIAPPP